ncbi:hypothetical protein [Bacteroides sp.]|uniref:DUF4906 domain-containing protein n=1 Tax=Bacteroides sp. TaxID=29523 RepID=UPI003AB6FF00
MNKLIHYIIFCSLFFTACNEETLPKAPPVSPDGEGVEIILNLAPQPIQAPAPATKSSAGNNNSNVLASSREGAMFLELLAEQPDAATRATEVDETTIDNAWIFLFNGVFSDGTNGTSANDPTLIKKLYKSDFQNDKGIRLTKVGTSGKQLIVVLANSFNPTLTNGLTENSSKYSALKALSSTVDIPTNRFLPMSGELAAEIPSTATDLVTFTVPVKRIVAKATMEVQLAEPDKYPATGYWTAQLCSTAQIYWYPNISTTATVPFPADTETFNFPAEEKIELSSNSTDSKTFTWYVPINLRGTVSNDAIGANRAKNAPNWASYIKITYYNRDNGYLTQRDYYIHLGANFTTDYNVAGNTHYTYKVKFYLNATEDTRVRNSNAVYLGMFGGELKETNGVYQFTKELWMQTADVNSSGTTAWKWTGAGTTNFISGKANTLTSVKSSTGNLAYKCFEKNEYLKPSYTSTDDPSFQWYLPAISQLASFWIVRTSIANDYLPTGQYWGSSQFITDSNCAWYMDSDMGQVIYAKKGDKSFKVRCVKELQKFE